MRELKDALVSYSRTDCYPFHMPGHKRRWKDFQDAGFYDITEIDGFDNLHHATGILKEAQERAAELYGSDKCFYLVNGSTCGLLAAVCAAVRKHDRVLLARNCHRAVYHALLLKELKAEYLYPVITKNDLQGHVTPVQVRRALEKSPDIKVVVITSPTYEGIVSDVRGIADAAHEKGVSLIVDAAHGAHLGFGGRFHENAVRLGADAVIMSLHKTLPSFTQTALLHLNADRIDVEKISRYLSIFQTSSPSYLFMAGMDSCMHLLSRDKNSIFADYREHLDWFYREVSDLKQMHVMTGHDLSREEAFGWDDSKLVVFSGQTGMSGEELFQILRRQYHLQMEMASGSYALGMTSIMDEKEGFRRLSSALHTIDEKCLPYCDEQKWWDINKKSLTASLYRKRERKMELYEAEDTKSVSVTFEEAEGKISAGLIFLYPPGIPVIVPGEVIRKELLEELKYCYDMGLCVEGGIDISARRIKIVYF